MSLLYYQHIAINRVIESILLGKNRVLVTMATGIGKTFVAFQICWKLWNSRWNRTGQYRCPKILYLADRNILVDDPMAKMFASFGDVRHKINGIHFNSSEEIHTLSHLYESMLREMRDASGDSGEFYTPRPVVRFMVAVVDPKLGETVLDPACGTGGFLVEAYDHLFSQVKTPEDRKRLQQNSLRGQEAKPFYVRLLSIKNEQARRFYETEALRGGWSVRQLDRQVNSQFFERTALSRNTVAMLEQGAQALSADAMTPEEAIKDPYVLEFLGLKDEYSEAEL